VLRQQCSAVGGHIKQQTLCKHNCVRDASTEAPKASALQAAFLKTEQQQMAAGLAPAALIAKNPTVNSQTLLRQLYQIIL
jgi:hypothetical protein